MIISKFVFIKTKGNKKLSHYKISGYDISCPEIKVDVRDLPLYCNVLVELQCDICGKIHTRKFVDYNRALNDPGKYACSKSCGNVKRKETFSNQTEPHKNSGKKIDKDKLVSILEKRKKTNLSRYGVEHVLQNEEVKEKYRNTSNDRYGVDNYSKTDDFIKNSKDSNIEKYGVDHPLKLESIKDRIKQTNLSKYGVESTLQLDISISNRLKHFKSENHRESYIISNNDNYIRYIGNSISLFKCDSGKDHLFEILYDNFKSRLDLNIPLCTTCYPIDLHRSIKEKEVYDFINSIYVGESISSYRDGLEIDIYLPDLKIGFEFNGLYYHSDKFKDKNYHLDKTKHFNSKGIRIIHIWEDDWNLRRNIVKSQIENWVGITHNKIYARKCEVVEILDSNVVRDFLDKNHIQGYVRSNIKLGLYIGDELISLMTFDQSEGRKKMEYGGWNLNRFCNKIGCSVIGGASKLLGYFINTYDPKRIVSYADRDWSIGLLYEKIGFDLIGESGPDYKYIVNNERVHKSRYKKKNLGIQDSVITESEYMKILGIFRIYDCGKIKFEIKPTQI